MNRPKRLGHFKTTTIGSLITTSMGKNRKNYKNYKQGFKFTFRVLVHVEHHRGQALHEGH